MTPWVRVPPRSPILFLSTQHGDERRLLIGWSSRTARFDTLDRSQFYVPLAQLGEHQTDNLKVAGAEPAWYTKTHGR